MNAITANDNDATIAEHARRNRSRCGQPSDQIEIITL